MKRWQKTPTTNEKFSLIKRTLRYIEAANLKSKEKIIDVALNQRVKQHITMLLMVGCDLPKLVDILLEKGVLTTRDAGDLRRASTQIINTLGRVLSKMPSRNVKSIVNLLEYNDIRFEARTAKVQQMYERIGTEDAWVLAEGTLQTCQDECDGRKKDCHYRQSLENLQVPKLDEHAEGCPYFYKNKGEE